MRFVRSGYLLLVFLLVMTAGLFAQSTVTSPEKFFGFQLGADRKMARWDKIVDYYGMIEKESGGRMKVVTDDGEEMEYGPGDFAVMAPGHDAWVVGDEACVVIDWQGFADYAKR